MKFHESGLPKHTLVEEAFNYSFNNVMQGQADSLKAFKQQIDMMHAQHMVMLDMEKKSGMPDDEYKKNKEGLEKMRDEQLRVGPGLIASELVKMFAASRVAPAKDLADGADNASPDLIAAMLLKDAVRSPIDFSNIEKKFGTGVTAVIADILHIDAYPSERENNLKAASAETKTAYLSLLVSSLTQMADQIAESLRENPFQKIMFPPGQEELLFNNAQALWGNDKKLDARFVDAFNKASSAAQSTFSIEVGANGEPELVKGAIQPPKPGKGGPLVPKNPGGGNGGLGGDVF